MNKQQNHYSKLVIVLVVIVVTWNLIEAVRAASEEESTFVQPEYFELVKGTRGTELNVQSVVEEPRTLIDITLEETQLEESVSQLMKWDDKLPQLDYGSYRPTKMANFGYNLYINPTSQKHLQTQYYYYHKKYNIGEEYPQLHMCVIAAGKNLLKNQKYKPFFQSVNLQNYTNFRLIVADDSSPDYSAFYIRQYIKSTLKHLHGRTTLIYNYGGVGALANKDSIIRKYCREGSIVVDVDADDALIGRQAMNVLNAVYQNESLWFVYTNHAVFRDRDGFPTGGYSKYIFKHIVDQNRYRSVEKYWVTGHIKTYRLQLYKLIPTEYFLDEKGKYYLWASDRYIMYAILQLSASDHFLHIPDCLYLYNHNPKRPECVMAPIVRDQYRSRSLTPFLPLSSLDDKPRRVQDYVMPQAIKYGLQEKTQILQKCQKLI